MGARTTEARAAVVAGRTAICTAEAAGDSLSYRGFDVTELAAQASYEEVAFLLLYGELPNAADLRDFRMRLAGARELPRDLKTLLERLPAAAHPMDVLRTGVSALGCLRRRIGGCPCSCGTAIGVPARDAALLVSIPCPQSRIETHFPAADLAGHFLHLLHGRAGEEINRRALEVSLILYAEHEFNASTLAARVITSTRAALSGHRGCHRCPARPAARRVQTAAMALIASFGGPDEAEHGILERLARKELIMGFGHRVYEREIRARR